MRAIYPASSSHHNEHHPSDADHEATSESAETDTDDPASPASDWLPLVTLVRIPTLSQLQCPGDLTQSCTITGLNFFLLQAVSANPDFSNPVAVPDGFTGATLSVPHVSAGTIFFKLRDDPTSINSAILPMPPPPVAHVHHVPHSAHGEDTPGQESSAIPTGAPPATNNPASSTQPTPASAPAKRESPTPSAPSSPTTTSPQ
jgi:hypothetical protein